MKLKKRVVSSFIIHHSGGIKQECLNNKDNLVDHPRPPMTVFYTLYDNGYNT